MWTKFCNNVIAMLFEHKLSSHFYSTVYVSFVKNNLAVGFVVLLTVVCQVSHDVAHLV